MIDGPCPNRETVRVLAALSDENRYRIVVLLAERVELSCGAIGEALGLSASLLSHHLSILEDARVVERKKRGLWTLNRLRRDELSRHLATLGRLVADPDGGAEEGAEVAESPRPLDPV